MINNLFSKSLMGQHYEQLDDETWKTVSLQIYVPCNQNCEYL